MSEAEVKKKLNEYTALVIRRGVGLLKPLTHG
jgi:hypothetical protein